MIAAVQAFLILAATTGPVEASSSPPDKLPVTPPPVTRRVEQTDEYHGVRVADPYRWLEDDVRQSDEVRGWVEAQNRVTFAYLEEIPQRKAIRQRLTDLWNFAKYSEPSQVAGRYFFRKNDGLQNQAVLYVSESLDGEPRVLLDPNQWTQDGTMALGAAVPSDDGKRLAYAVSEAGSDWQTLQVLNVDDGVILPDKIRWVRFGGVAWNRAGDGFYYGRYPEPDPGQQFQSLALNHKIYFHQLGTPQEQDVLIYERPDHPDWTFGIAPTEDNAYLVLEITKSTDDQNRVLYRPLAAGASDWTELIGDFENQFSFVGNEGSTFYFLTDLDAPTKRLVAMDVGQPGRDHLREVVAASSDTLESIRLLSGQFVANYLHDATSRVRIYDRAGKSLRDVQLPDIGSAAGFGGRQNDKQTFYSFSSYTYPPSIYHYDVTTGESRLWKQAEVAVDPSRFETRQVFYTSRDGTRVPMIVAHRKDLKPNGQLPTLLYAYGGFNISLTPQFSLTYILWMEMGGVVAVPNLRGGGEYGEAWHAAGKTLKKQNVFDDFIAAAEWLIDEKYTCPGKLAIQGGSNGGLLVGAVMTQRPELFGACLPAVGVMDMLRYQRFTAGRFWVDEYGVAENPEQFPALLKYSPYHNLKPGTHYPATLVTTADTDDRVVPMHSFKFAAALQHAQRGPAPTLIRIESRAGHGAGTPTSKRIENAADQLSFLVRALGVEVPADFPGQKQ